MPEKYVLRQYQALPLEAKEHMSLARIREWYDHWDGNVYVSFSGGKDSTVLAHLVHEFYPHVPLVFSNTGLEYPEVRQFAEKMGATTIYPQMSFSEVISTYGYPLISKEVSEAIYVARRIRNGTVQYREKKKAKKPWILGKREELQGRIIENSEGSKGSRGMYNKSKWLPLARDGKFMISNICCDVMKKRPIHEYQKKTCGYPYIGTLAEESLLRLQSWIRNGCNAFEASIKTSQPMSFWTEQDVLRYIVEKGLEIASVYGDIVSVDDSGMEYIATPITCDNLKCSGCSRTGCVYCMYGMHLANEQDRFKRLAKTHPKQYDYCMRGGQWVDNPNYDPFAPKMDGDWQNWNPKKIWVPSKRGLGMKHVFDECNEIYGKGFIQYE